MRLGDPVAAGRQRVNAPDFCSDNQSLFSQAMTEAQKFALLRRV
jgi:hypothetical protein